MAAISKVVIFTILFVYIDWTMAGEEIEKPIEFHYDKPAEYSLAKYNFKYSVHDGHTGDIKSQIESRDGDVVQGFYSVVDPDGYKRTVTYSADEQSGFKAVVNREHIENFQPLVYVAAKPTPTHIVKQIISKDPYIHVQDSHSHSSINSNDDLNTSLYTSQPTSEHYEVQPYNYHKDVQAHHQEKDNENYDVDSEANTQESYEKGAEEKYDQELKAPVYYHKLSEEEEKDVIGAAATLPGSDYFKMHSVIN